MRDFYNSLADLLKKHPLDRLTYEDIHYQFGTGQDNSTYQIGRDGRKHREKLIYRHGVQTSIGDIREDVWLQLVEKLIYHEYEGWLLDAMEEWYSVHGWQKYIKNYRNESARKADIRKSALNAVISRLHDNEGWVDYIQFNFKHRPSVLEGKVFLNIIPSCCKKPGQVSRHVNNHDGRYPCPHCGRSVPVEIIDEGPLDKNLFIEKEG